MHFSAPLFALTLLPAALAAPLLPREDTCTLQLNHTATGTITPALEDLRSRWTPILDEDGKVVSATVNNYGLASDAEWNVIPTGEAYKIQPASDPNVCASGVESGASPAQLSMVSCEADDALWTITCTTCQPTGGNVCQFHPLGRDDLCASRPYVDGYLDQEKPIEIVPCVGTQDEPYSWGQYFFLGRLTWD